MLVYIDTNIVLDLVRDRDSRTGRDLGTYSMSIFEQAKSCRFKVVISEWLRDELDSKGHDKEIEELFEELEEKKVEVKYGKKEREKAEELSSEDRDDALHGVLADKADADVLVTQNVADFRCVEHLVKVRKPSYL